MVLGADLGTSVVLSGCHGGGVQAARLGRGFSSDPILEGAGDDLIHPVPCVGMARRTPGSLQIAARAPLLVEQFLFKSYQF